MIASDWIGMFGFVEDVGVRAVRHGRTLWGTVQLQMIGCMRVDEEGRDRMRLCSVIAFGEV